MQVRMGLLNKKPDWSTERFREHWREHHSQLARQLQLLQNQLIASDAADADSASSTGHVRLPGVMC